MKNIILLIGFISVGFLGYSQSDGLNPTTALKKGSGIGLQFLATDTIGGSATNGRLIFKDFGTEWARYWSAYKLSLGGGTTNTLAMWGVNNSLINSPLVYNGADVLNYNVGANTPNLRLTTRNVSARLRLNVSATSDVYGLLAYDAVGEGLRYNVPGNRFHKFYYAGLEQARIDDRGIKTINGNYVSYPSYSFFDDNLTGLSIDPSALYYSVSANKTHDFLNAATVRMRIGKSGDLLLNTPLTNLLINSPFNTNLNQNVLLGQNTSSVNSTMLLNTIVGSGNAYNVEGGYYSAVFGNSNFGKVKNLYGHHALGGNNARELETSANYPSYFTAIFGNDNIGQARTGIYNSIVANYFGVQLNKIDYTTAIGGYYNSPKLIYSNNNVFIDAGFNGQLSNNTFTITNVNTTTNVLTISPALPVEFVGAYYFEAQSSTGTLPTPMVTGTNYQFDVLTATTIKPKSVTLTGTQTGGTFKRFIDKADNTVSVKSLYNGDNEVNFGNYYSSTFGLADRTTIFDLSKKSWTILDQDKAYLYDNTLGMLTPKQIPNFYNSDGIINSQRLVFNPSNYDTYHYGQGSLYYGVSGNVAKMDVYNTVANRTTLNVQGVGGRMIIDNGGLGLNEIRGNSVKFSNNANSIEYGNLGGSGLSMRQGTNSDPSFRILGTSTGWTGNSSTYEMIVGGVRRGYLDSNNDFNIGSGNTNEYVSKVNWRVWNGSASETMSWFGYGGLGVYGDVPTGREYNFRVNSVSKFSIGSVIDAKGTKITNVPTTGAVGSDVISVTQADATYVKKNITTVVFNSPTFAANTYKDFTCTVNGAVVGDIVWAKYSNITSNAYSMMYVQSYEVTANNTVVVRVYNPSSSSPTLGAVSFDIMLIK